MNIVAKHLRQFGYSASRKNRGSETHSNFPNALLTAPFFAFENHSRGHKGYPL